MAPLKQAMLLAAGRGERLAPLTDTTPKPLLTVGGKLAIEHHLHRLAAAGIVHIVVNLHHLGAQIQHALGDGTRYGVRLHYSPEPTLLGPGGGIRQAIASGLLTAPFLLANADIICDHDPRQLRPPPDGGCRLLLVTNPPEKNRGDFGLEDGRLVQLDDNAGCGYTYAGIGSYDPALFAALPDGAHELLPLLHAAIATGTAAGELHQGDWHDIGTPASLTRARAQHGE